jgi:hypothetical protein
MQGTSQFHFGALTGRVFRTERGPPSFWVTTATVGLSPPAGFTLFRAQCGAIPSDLKERTGPCGLRHAGRTSKDRDAGPAVRHRTQRDI